MVGSYKDLRAWKLSMEMAMEAYRQTEGLPREERYGPTVNCGELLFLSPVISLKVNGVHRTNELVLFLHHGRGSLLEVETQLLIAEGLRYVSETETRRLLRLVEALAKTLNALIKSLNPMAAWVPQLRLV